MKQVDVNNFAFSAMKQWLVRQGLWDNHIHAASAIEPNIYVGQDGGWRLGQERTFQTWSLQLNEPYYTMYILDHECRA